MKKAILTLTFGTLVIAYSNFDFFSWNHFEMDSVNEASRISHAKELLGKYYDGSYAQKLEGSHTLNIAIYNRVQSRLQGKWKAQAERISRALIHESTKYQFDPVFIMAIIQTESKFNPLTRGRFGEIGLMQVKPDTAAWIAKKYHLTWSGEKTLENPVANIRIGMAYMAYLRNHFDGVSNKYVSAYNMGPRNVKKLFAHKVRPKEYSLRVMQNYKDLYTTIAAQSSATVLADMRM
jgi:soluble lytic murein transglycosylase